MLSSVSASFFNGIPPQDWKIKKMKNKMRMRRLSNGHAGHVCRSAQSSRIINGTFYLFQNNNIINVMFLYYNIYYCIYCCVIFFSCQTPTVAAAIYGWQFVVAITSAAHYSTLLISTDFSVNKLLQYSTLLYNQNDSNCIKNIKQKSPPSAYMTCEMVGQSL